MKVLIADDDALIRDGLKILIGMEKDFTVCGTASNGMEAFEMCKLEKPDIVLMDIRMPVMDGVLGTKLIKEHFKEIKVVILTTFKDDEYIAEAIKGGAEGYILKSQPADSIIESLRTVMKGNMVFEKDVASAITSMISDKSSSSGNGGGKKREPGDELRNDITEREYEILKLIGEGLSNREIAQKMYLSDGTVRNYITVLLEKLNLRDRTQLAIYYLKNYE